MARTAALRDRLFDRLADLGMEVATPRDAAAGIVSARSADAEAVVARLHRQGVRVEARGALVRISPYFYNTDEEIDRFCALLADASLERSVVPD